MKNLSCKISSLFTKLSVILLTVMIGMAAFPANGAEAAEPKINVKAKTLFVGGSSVRPEYKATYTLKLKNKPKKYSVSWKSADESIATVKWMKSGKAELTAVGAGKTVVTAYLHDKVNEKDYELKVNLTIKRNCADLVINPDHLEDMDVGDFTVIEAKMLDADGNEAVHGKDVTDFIKWYSENPEIVEIDSYGRINAVSKGTTNIVFYASQTNVGPYAQPDKAVVVKKLECRVTGTRLISASQSALNKIKLVFSDPVKDVLKAEDVSVSTKFEDVKITEADFSDDGKTVTLTLLTSLNDGVKYNVAWGDYVMSFEAAKGVPASLELYTETDSDSLIVNKATEIKVRFIDANGVDVTPLSDKSDEYKNMMSHLVFRVTGVDMSGSTDAWMTGNQIMFTEPDKTVMVNAEYVTVLKEGDSVKEIKATGSLKVSCISVAHSMQLESIMFTNSTQSASKLDWKNACNYLAMNDVGYRAVARLWSAEGKYVYSDELGGKVTFSLENGGGVMGLFNDGTAYPFNPGNAVAIVYYDGVSIGAAEVGVVPERKASNIVFVEEGKYISSKVSSANEGVSSTELTVKVLDQYGAPIQLTTIGSSDYIGDLKFEIPDFGAPMVQLVRDNDGNAKATINAYGFGSDSGRSFKYQVKYDGAAGSVTSDFMLTAVIPDYKLESRYVASVKGNFDVSMNADAKEFPAATINLVEYKGDLANSNISSVYPLAENAIPSVGVYYYKVFDKDGKLCQSGNEVGSIRLVYANGSKLAKYQPGEYTLNIYKGVVGGYEFLSGTTFTVTDSKSEIKVEQLYEKIGQSIYPEMSSAEVTALFSSCFKLTRSNEQINWANITINEPVIGNKQIIFRTVTVKDYVTINGTAYYFETTVAVNKQVTN